MRVRHGLGGFRWGRGGLGSRVAGGVLGFGGVGLSGERRELVGVGAARGL